MAPSPSVALANGRPSKALFEKMAARANSDCDTPSSLKKRQPMTRASPNTNRHDPKKATSTRQSTGGRRDRSLIKVNSRAGKATVNTA